MFVTLLLYFTSKFDNCWSGIFHRYEKIQDNPDFKKKSKITSRHKHTHILNLIEYPPKNNGNYQTYG